MRGCLQKSTFGRDSKVAGKGELQSTGVGGTVDGSNDWGRADEKRLSRSGEVGGSIRMVKLSQIDPVQNAGSAPVSTSAPTSDSRSSWMIVCCRDVRRSKESALRDSGRFSVTTLTHAPSRGRVRSMVGAGHASRVDAGSAPSKAFECAVRSLAVRRNSALGLQACSNASAKFEPKAAESANASVGLYLLGTVGTYPPGPPHSGDARDYRVRLNASTGSVESELAVCKESLRVSGDALVGALMEFIADPHDGAKGIRVTFSK